MFAKTRAYLAQQDGNHLVALIVQRILTFLSKQLSKPMLISHSGKETVGIIIASALTWLLGEA